MRKHWIVVGGDDAMFCIRNAQNVNGSLTKHVVGERWKERLLLWPALSGGAILIERMSSKHELQPPVIYTEGKGNDYVLRQKHNATENHIKPSSQPQATYSAGQQKIQQNVSFVYVGNTDMTVTGPVSGIQYHFDRPGALVEVDPRDRVLLASIRQLRQTK